ncbi:hypothetical protein [Bacillus sp. JJ722]
MDTMILIILVASVVIMIEVFGIGVNLRKANKQNQEIIDLLKQLNNKK